LIGLDTNLLVHLLVGSSPDHERTRSWLDGIDEAVVTTQTNVGEVLGLVTHPRVFTQPATLAEASAALTSLFESYSIDVLQDEACWWDRFAAERHDLPAVRGNAVFDARIALCLRYHGVKRIGTFDTGFREYRFLEVVNPHSVR
jgi:toxin-antitoxin system PIN domain toxin